MSLILPSFAQQIVVERTSQVLLKFLDGIECTTLKVVTKPRIY